MNNETCKICLVNTYFTWIEYIISNLWQDPNDSTEKCSLTGNNLWGLCYVTVLLISVTVFVKLVKRNWRRFTTRNQNKLENNPNSEQINFAIPAVKSNESLDTKSRESIKNNEIHTGRKKKETHTPIPISEERTLTCHAETTKTSFNRIVHSTFPLRSDESFKTECVGVADDPKLFMEYSTSLGLPQLKTKSEPDPINYATVLSENPSAEIGGIGLGVDSMPSCSMEPKFKYFLIKFMKNIYEKCKLLKLILSRYYNSDRSEIQTIKESENLTFDIAKDKQKTRFKNLHRTFEHKKPDNNKHKRKSKLQFQDGEKSITLNKIISKTSKDKESEKPPIQVNEIIDQHTPILPFKEKTPKSRKKKKQKTGKELITQCVISQADKMMLDANKSHSYIQLLDKAQDKTFNSPFLKQNFSNLPSTEKVSYTDKAHCSFQTISITEQVNADKGPIITKENITNRIFNFKHNTFKPDFILQEQSDDVTKNNLQKNKVKHGISERKMAFDSPKQLNLYSHKIQFTKNNNFKETALNPETLVSAPNKISSLSTKSEQSGHKNENKTKKICGQMRVPSTSISKAESSNYPTRTASKIKIGTTDLQKSPSKHIFEDEPSTYRDRNESQLNLLRHQGGFSSSNEQSRVKSGVKDLAEQSSLDWKDTWTLEYQELQSSIEKILDEDHAASITEGVMSERFWEPISELERRQAEYKEKLLIWKPI